jgi:dTMP kinase
MKKARYIVFEGTEGVGKTTQVVNLTEHLKKLGYSVLQTKEPGTPLLPVTMELRNLMLNNDYDSSLTRPAREFISQAIRSVHIEKLIMPALKEYDFIIQDRGILSGLAYGAACGNNYETLVSLAMEVTSPMYTSMYNIYDDVIYLTGNVETGLNKALSSKREFKSGDAMESRGSGFIRSVGEHMDTISRSFPTKRVNVDGKNIEEVFHDILSVLKIKGQ